MTLLVIFEVFQQRRFHRDVEVVRLVGPYGYKTCRHGEAVQVATDGAVHVCKFACIKVVAGGEVERPTFCEVEVTR